MPGECSERVFLIVTSACYLDWRLHRNRVMKTYLSKFALIAVKDHWPIDNR